MAILVSAQKNGERMLLRTATAQSSRELESCREATRVDLWLRFPWTFVSHSAAKSSRQLATENNTDEHLYSTCEWSVYHLRLLETCPFNKISAFLTYRFKFSLVKRAIFVNFKFSEDVRFIEIFSYIIANVKFKFLQKWFCSDIRIKKLTEVLKND